MFAVRNDLKASPLYSVYHDICKIGPVYFSSKKTLSYKILYLDIGFIFSILSIVKDFFFLISII